jgi:hypothetical protein
MAGRPVPPSADWRGSRGDPTPYAMVPSETGSDRLGLWIRLPADLKGPDLMIGRIRRPQGPRGRGNPVGTWSTGGSSTATARSSSSRTTGSSRHSGTRSTVAARRTARECRAWPVGAAIRSGSSAATVAWRCRATIDIDTTSRSPMRSGRHNRTWSRFVNATGRPQATPTRPSGERRSRRLMCCGVWVDHWRR